MTLVKMKEILINTDSLNGEFYVTTILNLYFSKCRCNPRLARDLLGFLIWIGFSHIFAIKDLLNFVRVKNGDKIPNING